MPSREFPQFPLVIRQFEQRRKRAHRLGWPADAAESWVTWQVRGDAATVRTWLNSFSARK